MRTVVELTPDIEQRLEALAARTGRSKREQLQDIIAQGVEDMEDYYQAAEVLKRVQQGQERVYSAEAVRRELGLEG